MTSYARKVDRNQAEIVLELRRAGCLVMVTSRLGASFPDLVVARGGVVYLLEVKNPEAGGALTPGQAALVWALATVGVRLHVVGSVAEALRAVGLEVEGGS